MTGLKSWRGDRDTIRQLRVGRLWITWVWRSRVVAWWGARRLTPLSWWREEEAR